MEEVRYVWHTVSEITAHQCVLATLLAFLFDLGGVGAWIS